jgi:hypothetical protein
MNYFFGKNFNFGPLTLALDQFTKTFNEMSMNTKHVLQDTGKSSVASTEPLFWCAEPSVPSPG